MEKELRKEKFLFLLDEIQKLSNWEDQLKRIYDTFGKNIKIIISGSESLFIKKKSKETLAGRMFEFNVGTLTFREFLCFREADYKPIGLHEKELKKLLGEFALTLGFPELANVKEKDIIKKYVREGIVEKVVYRELAKELKISRQTLSNYFSYLEDSFLVKKLYNFSRSRRKAGRKLKKISREKKPSKRPAGMFFL